MKKTFLMLCAAASLAACDADEGDLVDRAGDDVEALPQPGVDDDGHHGKRHHGECDGECDGECEHGKGHHGKAGHFGGDPEQHARRVIEKLDTDGDGSISAEEAKAHPRMGEHFAKLDADGDGQLTSAELIEAKKAHRGRGGHHRMGPPEDHAKRMIEKLDADGDGQISEAEAADKPHLAERFSKLDADGDGQVTEQEMLEHHRQKRARAQEP